MQHYLQESNAERQTDIVEIIPNAILKIDVCEFQRKRMDDFVEFQIELIKQKEERFKK